MNHAPALIVRHRRFTLVIGVLLACLMAIAAMGVSIELHRAHAELALVLLPQIFVLVASGMIKLAYDRWATSLVCLSISAEGLALPGIATRPIPWTVIRSVRGICCNPTPEHAITPRHYMLFDVETPALFGIDRPGIVRRHEAPLPAGAPLVTLDISELDTSKEAILDAVRRFHPAAVADADARRSNHPAAGANDVSIRFPSVQEITVGAQRLSDGATALLARRNEVWPAAVAEWNRLAPRARNETRRLMVAAVALQRTTVAQVQLRALTLRDVAAAHLARGQQVVHAAALGLRHRFDRSV